MSDDPEKLDDWGLWAPFVMAICPECSALTQNTSDARAHHEAFHRKPESRLAALRRRGIYSRNPT
jgi:hypothetical protein